VIKGQLEVATYSEEDGLKLTYMAEGDDVLYIPPKVWHGFRVLGNEEAILLYYVTKKFDPENPDEERARWDTFYNWETPKK
jgi:dTDP-4-dehydrorhamnose 3,5-epimerase